jgi:hypothetical protein
MEGRAATGVRAVEAATVVTGEAAGRVVMAVYPEPVAPVVPAVRPVLAVSPANPVSLASPAGSRQGYRWNDRVINRFVDETCSRLHSVLPVRRPRHRPLLPVA